MWTFPSYFNWSWNSPLLYNQIWPTLLSCKHLQRSVCCKALLFFFFFLKSGGSVKKGSVSLKRGSPQWTLLSEEVGSYLSICARSSWLGTPTVRGKKHSSWQRFTPHFNSVWDTSQLRITSPCKKTHGFFPVLLSGCCVQSCVCLHSCSHLKIKVLQELEALHNNHLLFSFTPFPSPSTFHPQIKARTEEGAEEDVMATGELNPNHYPARRAAQVVQHYLNTRYGSPFRLIGVQTVHSGNAEVSWPSTLKYVNMPL